MKKTIIALVILLFIISIPASTRQERRYVFLTDGDIDVNDNDDATHGTEFTGRTYDISHYMSRGNLEIWFTPAVPAAVDITFIFATSANGTDFTTEDSVYSIAVPTNSRSTSGEVRVIWPFPFDGIHSIRLQYVGVASGAGNCTDINAAISF